MPPVFTWMMIIGIVESWVVILKCSDPQMSDKISENAHPNLILNLQWNMIYVKLRDKAQM